MLKTLFLSRQLRSDKNIPGQYFGQPSHSLDRNSTPCICTTLCVQPKENPRKAFSVFDNAELAAPRRKLIYHEWQFENYPKHLRKVYSRENATSANWSYRQQNDELTSASESAPDSNHHCGTLRKSPFAVLTANRQRLLGPNSQSTPPKNRERVDNSHNRRQRRQSACPEAGSHSRLKRNR